MMKITDPATGEELEFDANADFWAELDAATPACQHPATEVRRMQIKGGAVQFRHQCLNCGEPVGQAVSRAKAPAIVADFDDALRAQRESERQQRRFAIELRHARMQQEKGSAWWQRYNAYLQTPEWQARREKVFRRAGGVCEGCGDAKATVVHHLTYEHVCNEFLFELVALCEPCHERIHADDSPGEAA